jgi:ABC-type branched-subunit amino acid transport system substrate-binding protein
MKSFAGTWRRARRRPLAVVACLAALTAAGCSSSSGPAATTGSSSDGPIVIGLGALVIPGEYDASAPMQAGIKAAEGYINAHGGWGGRKVQVVTCTSPGDASSDLACYRQMISDHATAMMGLMSYNAEYLPLLAKAGIPDFVFTTSEAEEKSPWEMQITPSNIEAYAVSAKFACAKGDKNVSVLNQDLPSARANEAIWADGIFQACGIKVNNAYIPLGTADPAPYIQKAISNNPQLLIIPGTTIPEGTLLDAIHSAGFPIDRVIGVPDGNPGWLSAPNTAGIMMLVPGGYAVPQDTSPAIQTFMQALQKYSPGANPLEDSLPLSAFQNTYAIWQAGQAVGFKNLNGTTLYQYMNGKAPGHLQIYASHTVVVPPGLPGVKEPYTDILQWTGSKLTDLGWWAGDWTCNSAASCASTTPPAGSKG